MEASISFKSVSKKINQKTIFADLSFGIEKNTKFAIVGPNLSGKSSIIKLASGILFKDRGEIYVKGLEVKNRTLNVKAIIGYMPQNIDYDMNLNFLHNITVYGQLYGMTSKTSKNKAKDILKIFNLHKYSAKMPIDIPKSVLRIGMFIRSILHSPDILLLDEPTANLDPILRNKFWDYINGYCKNNTILFTTQNLVESEKYADRIAILYEGEIKFLGSYQYLIENSKELNKFSIVCKNKIDEEIIKKLTLNPKIIKLKIIDKRLRFYSTDKNEFYNLLKDLIKLEISDIDSSKCSLEDILLGMIK